MNNMIENEISPETLTGSFSKELMLSKLYLLEKLRAAFDQLGIDHVHTAYILGSWYGNLSILMALDNFPVQKIINVDKNSHYIGMSKRALARLGAESQHMTRDANNLDYRQLRKPSLVVNTSCNDISGLQWFRKIPPGTIVALDAGDQLNSVNQFDSVGSLSKSYPLSKTIVKDEFNYNDYRRFIVIGIK